MKIYKFLILFTIVLLVQCTGKTAVKISIEEIKGTEWDITIAEGCISILSFMDDNTYIDYNCEMEDTLYGSYKIEGNNLVLYQEGSIYDKIYDEGSPHRIGKAKFKLSLNNDKLRYILREDYFDGEWTKSKHTFPEDYYYNKIKQ